MILIKKIWPFLLLLIAAGCEETTEWDLNSIKSDYLIVEALITNEKRAHEVILSKPVTYLNAPARPVAGASVLLSDNDTTYILVEDSIRRGFYLTDSTYRAVVGKDYRLEVVYNDQSFVANTKMLPVTPFDTLKYYQTNDSDTMFAIDWVSGGYDPDEPAMFEIVLDWSDVSGYENYNTESCIARLWYYTLTTIDVNQVFAPGKDVVTFPAGTKIKQRKYSITPEHERYLRSLLSEAEWRGGFFDVMPANIETNFNNGALGFFAVCTVSEIEFIAR